MTSTTFFFVFIPILAIILLAVNIVFAPHNPYQEKDSAFECGFHSFLGQNRSEFSISFFIFALLFLVLTLGFAFELGKNALSIDSRQVNFFKSITTKKKKKIARHDEYNYS